ncbi:MAG TPA: RHS repeat-associated core domain-containing protein, partial [Ktedonobacterales bacterium]|nr:RHS repeat-associated core domain-containing protein [Ktedonobacterales bacterium]
SSLTTGLVTTSDQYTNCGTKANNFTDQSGLIRTITGYDAFGNPITTIDPDAYLGNNAHKGCTVNSVPYTTCTAYDTTFDALPVSTTNALNQTASIGYTATAVGGFGLWPTSTTDVNGQTTTTTYDALGRPTSQTLPGETSGETTTTTSYTIWCTPGNARVPCVEVDTTQRLDSTTIITTRAFYDGFGRLVEIRSPGPNSPGPNAQDVVQYRYYDPSGRDIEDSIQYLVPAYTGAAGSNAYSIPDDTQAVSSTTYDGLGRVTSTKDALSNITTTSYTIACGTISGDSACYEQTLLIDPLHHKQGKLVDALGREIYDQRYTGNSTSTYVVYATTKYTYDYNANLTQIADQGGNTTTFQYDMAGRQTGQTDPDRGTLSYVYDADGNLVQTTDARGSSGTAYAGFDGLNRVIWRSVNSNGSSPYVTYTYDSTANGNDGVGRLTGETFAGGPGNSLTGSYSYVYDVRGQQIGKTLVVGATSYPFQTTYDDAGNILTQTYPTGEVVTDSYTGGWFSGLSQQQNSSNTTLLSNVSYTGAGGAAHMITGATLDGGTYQYAATYDLLVRQTELKDTRVSDNAVMFDEQRQFDAAGNVTSDTTTLPQGTDVQQFCYDEQNRLTWAGSVGTPPCTGTAITPGTLTSAEYTQSFTYDTLGRLTNGPLGAYTYGSSAHLHAVTTIGSTYSASYDAAGNMTCRSSVSASACVGTPTGAALSYDVEGRLSHWQDTPTNPTTTDDFLYDGEGNRVEQQVTQGGTTTTTVYVGGFEEVSTTGSTTTTTTYYYAGTMRVALAVNGVFSYLATNGLGSISVALTASGSAQASALYYPYGGGRYSSGTMPGSYGYTGQQADGTTGLDDYATRYYDPLAGQFVSADTVLPGKGFDPWGLSRYAYVEGNPIARTDPTGHRVCADSVSCGTGGGSNGSTGGASPCDSGLCNQIVNTFHNPDIISVLYLMLFSDFGTKVVEFLLKFAAYEESRFDRSIGTLKGPHPSFDADSLFQFD